MSKPLKPGKAAVELRPSRIRRDPVRTEDAEAKKKLHWRTDEREIKLALIGIVLFALAINAVVVGVSATIAH